MKTRVGILGARSFVAAPLLPRLQNNHEITTFSRNWQADCAQLAPIPNWISLIPIVALPEQFDTLFERGAKRIVVLSSTSRLSKTASSDPAERTMALRIAESESRLAAWAEARGIEWLIIRPTLIYGHGRDQNVSEIARFIRRFGFFPVVGAAQGRRQPIHCEDLARACARALEARHLVNRAYNIPGGEVVTYRTMVIRIFEALDRQPRLVVVPLWMFSAAIACARLLPRFRHWTTAMAERMNQDLVFDHSLAARDLDFAPRRFHLSAADLPH